mmetsp:Transcript_55923/g.163433  ORF Transcript_55923/g.163433 Transcript_55923/m.163433 type:complete len:328 (-) Transcript_55923:583-1566(-)
MVYPIAQCKESGRYPSNVDHVHNRHPHHARVEEGHAVPETHPEVRQQTKYGCQTQAANSATQQIWHLFSSFKEPAVHSAELCQQLLPLGERIQVCLCTLPVPPEHGGGAVALQLEGQEEGGEDDARDPATDLKTRDLPPLVAIRVQFTVGGVLEDVHSDVGVPCVAICSPQPLDRVHVEGDDDDVDEDVPDVLDQLPKLPHLVLLRLEVLFAADLDPVQARADDDVGREDQAQGAEDREEHRHRDEHALQYVPEEISDLHLVEASGPLFVSDQLYLRVVCGLLHPCTNFPELPGDSRHHRQDTYDLQGLIQDVDSPRRVRRLYVRLC